MTQYTTSKKEEIAKVYTPENCKVFEMVQYQCEANRTNIECTPFVRLFLRCAGIPTVEVTPEYDQYGDPITSILPSTSTTQSQPSSPSV